MIYKITMMSGQEIPLENEEALQKFLEEANAGKKLVLTKFGVVNVASIDSITPHKELMAEVWQDTKLGTPRDRAEQSALGESPFIKLLGLPPATKRIE